MNSISQQLAKSKFKQDWQLLFVLLTLGLAGLIIYCCMEKSAFPTASINLDIPKSQILACAQDWAKNLGFVKKNQIKSIVFDLDDSAKTFLEYELGNDRANSLMSSEIPVFYWECSFHKEFDKETMNVCLSPTGQLISFDHDLENDRAITSIAHPKAQAIAFDFVKEHTGWNENQCKLVEDSSKKQVHRIDHSFTWELISKEWHGATLRASARLSGNILSSYNFSLHRPQEWDRKYETIRSNNQLLEAIASVFFFLLLIGALFIFFQSVSKHQVRWQFILILAGFMAMLSAADAINSFQQIISQYSPESSFTAYIVQSLLHIVEVAIFVFCCSTVLAGAGEVLYRHYFPKRIAIEKCFSLGSLTSQEMIHALIAGHAGFAISLGYQILYYTVGRKFHFWCPLSIDDHRVLTAFLPSLSAAVLGVFAAGMEEVVYRVVALGLIQKITRNFWIANFLQAAAWGFMHSTYPQQPAYARGVELTIDGMFMGWLYKRYGIVACLVSHYVFDAFSSVTCLLSAHSLSLKLAGMIPVVPFLVLLLICTILRQRRGAVAVEPRNEFINTGIRGTLADQSIEVLASGADKIYQPLSKTMRLTLTSLIMILLATALVFQPTTRIHQDPTPLKIKREQAVEAARRCLQSQNFKLNGYWSSTSLGSTLSNDYEEYQYVFEQLGFDKTNKLAEELEHSSLWFVRFFKPLSPEEFLVAVDEQGSVRGQVLKRAEDGEGAKLTEAAACKIAERYLRRYRPNYLPLVFDDFTQVTHKNRIDYDFNFKVPRYRVADAQFKVKISVIGDKPSFATRYWDLPDQWTWERRKRSTKDEICKALKVILGLVSLIILVLWSISLFRENRVRWRTAFILSAIMLGSILLTGLNALPGLLQSYVTTIPMPTFLACGGLGMLIGLAVGGALLAFIFAISLASFDKLRSSYDLKASLRLIAASLGPSKGVNGNFWLDGLLLASFYGLAGYVLGQIESAVRLHFAKSVMIGSFSNLNGSLNDFLVWINPVTLLVGALLIFPPSLAALAAICSKYGINTFWRFCVAALLLAALQNSTDRYWQDYTIALIFACAWIPLYWLALKGIRHNPLAIFLYLWLTHMFASVYSLYIGALNLYPTDFGAEAAILALPFAYVCYLWIVSDRRNPKAV